MKPTVGHLSSLLNLYTKGLIEIGRVSMKLDSGRTFIDPQMRAEALSSGRKYLKEQGVDREHRQHLSEKAWDMLFACAPIRVGDDIVLVVENNVGVVKVTRGQGRILGDDV